MTKLNYTTFAELLADFKAGAKFSVIDSTPGGTGPVSYMAIRGEDLNVGVEGSTTTWGSFQPDGSNRALVSARLIKTAEAPLVFPTITVPAGSLLLDGSIKVTPVPATEPLLKRLLNGETFHCPKTRETLEGFVFERGSLRVRLANGDGLVRESTNYDHTGKHKWHAERSLVAGPVPELEPRGTGRSTNLALKYVREALDRPGTHIAVRDHHDSARTHRDLALRVASLLDALGVVSRLTGNLICVLPRKA